MGRQIVQHNVNLSGPAHIVRQSRQELDEVRTGVATGGLALHLSGLHIQCGIQRQRAMPVILEAVPPGASG